MIEAKGMYLTHVSQLPLSNIVKHCFKYPVNLTITSTEFVESDVIEVGFTLHLSNDIDYEDFQEFRKRLSEVGKIKYLGW